MYSFIWFIRCFFFFIFHTFGEENEDQAGEGNVAEDQQPLVPHDPIWNQIPSSEPFTSE